MPDEKMVVQGETALRVAVDLLATWSTWFEITPLPGDRYEINTREITIARLRTLLDKNVAAARLGAALEKEGVVKPQPTAFLLDFKPMKGYGGGLRSEWVTAETKDFKAGIDTGAGLGNAMLTFWIESPVGSKRRYYTASIGPLFEKLVEAFKQKDTK